MPTVVINWTWDEAFDKFGFADGDGPVYTHEVAAFIESLGYEVESDSWGMHNTVIFSIKRDGVEVIPADAEHGYDCPSTYLPADLVAALTEEFGPVDPLSMLTAYTRTEEN